MHDNPSDDYQPLERPREHQRGYGQHQQPRDEKLVPLFSLDSILSTKANVDLSSTLINKENIGEKKEPVILSIQDYLFGLLKMAFLISEFSTAVAAHGKRVYEQSQVKKQKLSIPLIS